MESAEIWKAIPGFEGLYEASNLGRIRGLDRLVNGRPGLKRVVRGRMMKVTVYKGAVYPSVMLSKNGKYGCQLAHILICGAFHGPKPEGCWVRHKNGNCLDNRASNLAWGTPKENMEDQYRHGTRISWKNMAHAKLDPDKVRQIKRRLKQGEYHRAIAVDYGVSKTTISFINRGRAWARITI